MSGSISYDSPCETADALLERTVCAPQDRPGPEWTPAPDDSRFPGGVDGYTEDFGDCPCGQGRIVCAAEPDEPPELTEDGTWAMTFSVSCTGSGDILATAFHTSNYDGSDGLSGYGDVDWYARCSAGLPGWPGLPSA